MLPRSLRVSETRENEDGSLTVYFDVDIEFIEWFKKTENLKRWSSKRFEKWVIEGLSAFLEIETKN